MLITYNEFDAKYRDKSLGKTGKKKRWKQHGNTSWTKESNDGKEKLAKTNSLDKILKWPKCLCSSAETALTQNAETKVKGKQGNKNTKLIKMKDKNSVENTSWGNVRVDDEIGKNEN